MKQIINFKLKKGKFYKEEMFPEVEIVNIDNKVWADLPIGIINPIVDYEKTFLGFENVILNEEEAKELFDKVQSTTRIYKLKADEHGNLTENEDGDIVQRLPIDTDVSKLALVDGEIILIEGEEQYGEHKGSDL